MSISLADALEDVELEPGQTYSCEVRGRHVEVHVFRESPTARTELGLPAEDVMLDPWCELPGPTPIGTLPSVLVERLPIDIPKIPSSEDSA